jgi:PAS domain S-box-containing protein
MEPQSPKAAPLQSATKPTYNELKKKLEDLEKRVGDLQQRETAVREKEEKHLAILQNIADSYFEIDLKGHLVFFNEATVAIMGFSREQLLGMNYLQFCAHESREKIRQALIRIQQSGTPVCGLEFELVRVDAQKKEMEM